ncbi:hypothetical protein E2562_011483 [Oryza meyeriana var. granulata]|uniref:Uncharacterized protein n=1 Tax=Oryza meyeriana var. granulata TaxID=110450 RepID=A0A6G1D0U6_9ORYZ|nr:hypothetical protein E2562_011483 [Oryza meyeriana var. granulata]
MRRLVVLLHSDVIRSRARDAAAVGHAATVKAGHDADARHLLNTMRRALLDPTWWAKFIATSSEAGKILMLPWTTRPLTRSANKAMPVKLPRCSIA